jgi:hypothetical protein
MQLALNKQMVKFLFKFYEIENGLSTPLEQQKISSSLPIPAFQKGDETKYFTFDNIKLSGVMKEAAKNLK